MSDPFIKAEDRIDVIGRLTARLDNAGAETLREKAAARAQSILNSDPPTPEKPVKDEGEKDQKDVKDEGQKDGEKDQKEFKEEGEKDQKDVKDEGEKEEKDEKDQAKELKDDGEKEQKDEKDGEKDQKDHKDGDEKDLPKDDPKDGIFEGPDDRSTAPQPERLHPGRPVM